MWLTIEGNHITLYNSFPDKFLITKEVNKNNHFFVPKTFHEGTIMYYKKENFKLSNRMRGIPLAETLISLDEDGIIPTTQINYDYIKSF